MPPEQYLWKFQRKGFVMNESDDGRQKVREMIESRGKAMVHTHATVYNWDTTTWTLMNMMGCPHRRLLFKGSILTTANS